MTFIKDYLAEGLETKMLADKFPELMGDVPNLVPNAVKFANTVREGFKNGDVGMPVSTRDLINFLDLVGVFPLMEDNNKTLMACLKYSITNRMTDEDRESVENMFSRCLDTSATSPNSGTKTKKK
jgi:hypothetical protein